MSFFFSFCSYDAIFITSLYVMSPLLNTFQVYLSFNYPNYFIKFSSILVRAFPVLCSTWVSRIKFYFCFLIPVGISNLICGNAIPLRLYRFSFLVGFKHLVLIWRILFVAVSFFFWFVQSSSIQGKYTLP